MSFENSMRQLMGFREFQQMMAYETSKDKNLTEIYSEIIPQTFTFSSESVITLVYQK